MDSFFLGTAGVRGYWNAVIQKKKLRPRSFSLFFCLISKSAATNRAGTGPGHLS